MPSPLDLAARNCLRNHTRVRDGRVEVSPDGLVALCSLSTRPGRCRTQLAHKRLARYAVSEGWYVLESVQAHLSALGIASGVLNLGWLAGTIQQDFFVDVDCDDM